MNQVTKIQFNNKFPAIHLLHKVGHMYEILE